MHPAGEVIPRTSLFSQGMRGKLFYLPLQNAAGKPWLQLNFQAQTCCFDGGKLDLVPSIFFYRKISSHRDGPPGITGLVEQLP